MSETLKVLEVDALTGEQTIRDLTSEEIEIQEQIAVQSEIAIAEAQAKADARASALAKLADLGLTQDEINAL